MDNGLAKIEKAENKCVLETLIANTKKDKWITGGKIAEILKNNVNSTVDYTDIHVREIIKRLRRKSLPVIASSRGYKVTTDMNEIYEQIASLRGRAEDMLQTARSLEVIVIKKQAKAGK